MLTCNCDMPVNVYNNVCGACLRSVHVQTMSLAADLKTLREALRASEQANSELRGELEMVKADRDQQYQEKIGQLQLIDGLDEENAALKAENASLTDQLQWAHKNETQYKDAAVKALSERNEAQAEIAELKAKLDAWELGSRGFP